MSHDGRPIGTTAVILAGIAVVVWTLIPGDDDANFRAVAYPCLPLDSWSTDPADFVMVTGLRAPPMQHTLADGTEVYPVFSHPDPAVVPLVDGRTVYFPAKLGQSESFELQTPPLPPHNRPLPKERRFELVRHLPDETRTALESAVERNP